MIRILLTGCIVIIFNSIAFTQDFTKYVDPFIGTGGHGHTYPGAVMPHGMVQLSPDTRLEGWDGCSGYHYSDNFIYGFSHTHLSGTGVSDYGDILLMPVTNNPSPDNKKYGAGFSHKNEIASTGFYSVKLDNGVKVELTASDRVGWHRYLFPKGGGNVILDLKHRDKVLASEIRIIGNNQVEGMRRSEAWARDQHIYFVIEFSTPFTIAGIWKNDSLTNNIPEANGLNLKAYFSFPSDNASEVKARVGISSVSIEGARKNLAAEAKDWDFNKIRNNAHAAWRRELAKIEIKGGTEAQLKTFYTALYHTMVVPSLNMDIDGSYRGRDNKIHSSATFTNYTVFSLWDTYRAANPLYTIIDQKRTLDYIQTFLIQYQQGGRLPVWELSNNETDCMIGYHAVPVIVDAASKGINNFDKPLALEAMKKSATWNHYGIPALISQGYLEAANENESVSKTLEYAYDDWCIAQFAKSIGRIDDYHTYIRRAQGYKNLLDPVSGFMRPKKNGNWITPFDPKEVNNNFTEANSWQYSFYVPQDVSGYLSMLGGRKRLEQKLDSLFSENTQTTGREQSDITGLIGQYAHGNEPSHHIIYLYNFAGKAYKTQQRIHQVMNEMYHAAPDGLAGNEDCGQMSAWYVLSALGFYPVTPASGNYIIGTPLFKQAIIHLENGKSFNILANGVSDKRFYIRDASLNAHTLTTSYFKHLDIMKGGNLVFNMSASPSMFGNNNFPTTQIVGDAVTINPVIDGGDESFYGSKTIKLSCTQPGVKIYYTLDGQMPAKERGSLYKGQFNISSTTNIRAIAVDGNGQPSKVTTAQFHQRKNDYAILSATAYEPEYAAGGKQALLDELYGTPDWRKGNWQGYQNNDVDVTIDMKVVKIISNVKANFIQDVGAWIVMPKEVIIEVSEDQLGYKQVFDGKDFLPVTDIKVRIAEVAANFPPVQARYVRFRAVQYGKLPTWHESAGSQSHIFIDEIGIK